MREGAPTRSFKTSVHEVLHIAKARENRHENDRKSLVLYLYLLRSTHSKVMIIIAVNPVRHAKWEVTRTSVSTENPVKKQSQSHTSEVGSSHARDVCALTLP